MQSAPYDEQRRHRPRADGGQAFDLTSYTSRVGAYHEVPTNAVVFEIDARGEDRLMMALTEPASQSFEYTFAELEDSSQIEFTGPFPSESFLLHRLVPVEHYEASFELDDDASGEGEDWYYVRVMQANGHMAWCSPVWVADG